jgi:hypothetical protein
MNMQPETLVVEIIKEQSLIIGESLAKSRAAGVVKFNSKSIEDVTITQPNPQTAIETLVKSYEEVFGQASVEVCMDVLRRHPIDQILGIIPDNFRLSLAH